MTGWTLALLAASLFQASRDQPYHLSIGAVLFDENGRIACHHFDEIGGFSNLYILMRETMENGEAPLVTLERGLQEEFGATSHPVAFLGSLIGPLPAKRFSFEKTTLYFACEVEKWDPQLRDPDDPEGGSQIEWFEPDCLIDLMQAQGVRLKRIDADESEMIRRAIPYIQRTLSLKKSCVP